MSGWSSGKITGMLDVRTLTDGGQQPLEMARAVAEFVGAARTSLDFAHYDFHLAEDTASVVCGAIKEAAARGVAVRFLYNLDHRNPIPVPPPPEPDGTLIESLGVPVRAIAGVPDLMHHKFVVRDAETVWTGSMNWTDESFSRQENLIAVAESRGLAERFTKNVDELWEHGSVERSGHVDTSPVEVGTLEVRPWFTPGQGEDLSQRIGKVLGRARRRIRIASPVITAAPILGALAQIISEGRVDVAGCVDQPQVRGVIYQWHQNGNVSWKLPLLERVLQAPFSGKRSTPWGPGTLHDFMHAKVTVADDTVFLGSYNHSRAGELNAENVLEIEDGDLAERIAQYIDEIRARYPAFSAE